MRQAAPNPVNAGRKIEANHKCIRFRKIKQDADFLAELRMDESFVERHGIWRECRECHSISFTESTT